MTAHHDRNDSRTHTDTAGKGGGREVSPFEDPGVIAEITAILQQGYDRYLAAQHAQQTASKAAARDNNRERDRADPQERDREQNGGGGRDADGDRAA